MSDALPHVLHATSVAVAGRGLLITGASGSGKSSLAMQLISLGATLIADDRTEVRIVEGELRLDCPPTIAGRIEARGLGILEAPTVVDIPLWAVLDLDQAETERLPPRRATTIIGQSVALLHKPMTPHFSAAVFHYLRYGRAE